MSNECPFKNMQTENLEIDPKKIAKFPEETLVEFIVENIPSAYKKGMHTIIVQLAALLPPQRDIEKILKGNLATFDFDTSKIKAEHEENLYKMGNAIRASHALLIRNHLYKENTELIENLAKLSSFTKEGAEFWEHELHKSLMANENFKTSFKAWGNPASIKKMIELFHLPQEEIKKIGSCILAENMKLYDRSQNNALSCLCIAYELEIEVDLKDYKKIADKFMKLANNTNCDNDRRTWVEHAYNIYEFLKEKYKFSDDMIDAIVEDCKNFKKQEAIKKASIALKFTYKRRGWEKLIG